MNDEEAIVSARRAIKLSQEKSEAGASWGNSEHETIQFALASLADQLEQRARLCHFLGFAVLYVTGQNAAIPLGELKERMKAVKKLNVSMDETNLLIQQVVPNE